MTTAEQIAEIRKTSPEELARDIVAVQPMPTDLNWNALEIAFAAMRAYRLSLGGHCCMDELDKQESK